MKEMKGAVILKGLVTEAHKCNLPLTRGKGELGRTEAGQNSKWASVGHEFHSREYKIHLPRQECKCWTKPSKHSEEEWLLIQSGYYFP